MRVSMRVGFWQPFMVPIIIDMPWNGKRYQDAFQWNFFDTSITVDEFAALTSEDLGYPPAFQVPFLNLVVFSGGEA